MPNTALAVQPRPKPAREITRTRRMYKIRFREWYTPSGFYNARWHNVGTCDHAGLVAFSQAILSTYGKYVQIQAEEVNL